MKKIISFGAVLGFMPVFAFAATTSIANILVTLMGYVNFIIPALITIAVAYFIWGVISFMTSSDEEAKKNGRAKIINGLIGLFIIVAFWGIIGIVKNSFQIDNSPSGGLVPCTPNIDNNWGANC